MDKNLVRAHLEKNGYEIILEKRYKTHAWRFKLDNGTSVYCGDNNKVWADGKCKKEVEAYLSSCNLFPNNKVFIVYGRDTESRDKLIEMLSSWGIESLMLENLPVEGRTIIEQLEHYIPQANMGIVLATPDDVGYLAGCENEAKKRARQNVVLELGMLFSKLGRSRVIIVQKKCKDFENPSDIGGLLCFRFEKHIEEIADKIIRELNKQGYEIPVYK